MQVLPKGERTAHPTQVDVFHYDRIVFGYEQGTLFLQEVLPLVPDLRIELLDLPQYLFVGKAVLFLPGQGLLQPGQTLFGLSVILRVVGFPALVIHVEVRLGVIQPEERKPLRHPGAVHGCLL